MDDITALLRQRLETHRRNLMDLHQQAAELGPTAAGRTALNRQIEHEQAEIDRVETMLASLDYNGKSMQKIPITPDDRLRDDLARWQAAITLEVLDRTDVRMAPLEASIGKLTDTVGELVSTMRNQDSRLDQVERTMNSRLDRVERAMTEEKTLSRNDLLIGAVVLTVLLVVVIVVTLRLAI